MDTQGGVRKASLTMGYDKPRRWRFGGRIPFPTFSPLLPTSNGTRGLSVEMCVELHGGLRCHTCTPLLFTGNGPGVDRASIQHGNPGERLKSGLRLVPEVSSRANSPRRIP